MASPATSTRDIDAEVDGVAARLEQAALNDNASTSSGDDGEQDEEPPEESVDEAHGHYFVKSSRFITHVDPSDERYSYYEPKKTFAILLHSDAPLVCAMSGWSHANWTSRNRDGMVHLNQNWTYKALELFKSLGCVEEHEYDRNMPGRYLACFAESQCIAYFIYRYVLEDEDRTGPLGNLSMYRKEEGLQATIIVSEHSIWGHPMDVAKKLKAVLNVDIEVEAGLRQEAN